jgi:hypothetical protein
MQIDPDIGIYFAKLALAIYLVGGAIVAAIAYWGGRRLAAWAVGVGFFLICIALTWLAMPIEGRAILSTIQQILLNLVVIGGLWIALGVLSVIVGARISKRGGPANDGDGQK